MAAIEANKQLLRKFFGTLGSSDLATMAEVVQIATSETKIE